MSTPTPPRVLRALSRLFCRWVDPIYHEEMLGDLQEMYQERALAKGKPYAQMMHIVDTLHLLLGFSTFRFTLIRNNFMIKNMLLMAWRHALRQRQATLLNLVGLTLGIATCLIIALYVHHETNYDQMHSKYDRIYRVNQPLIWRNWDLQFASTGPNVALALAADIPEMETITRMFSRGEVNLRIQVGQNDFHYTKEDKFYGAEQNFFEVFDFPLIHGDRTAALLTPNSIILTEEKATSFFGDRNAVGQELEIQSEDGKWETFTVTGVLANIPDQSHLDIDMLFSLRTMDHVLSQNDWKWIWTTFSTYVVVKEGTNMAGLREKIQLLPPKWAGVTTERVFNQTFDEFRAGKPWTLYLQPLSELYLSEGPFNHRFGPTGNPSMVRIFGAIGVLVLLLSSINFMNLSTARSSLRAKEVGIRKVLGSIRYRLIAQFTVESILYVAVSTCFAMGIVVLLIPGFNQLTEKEIALLPHLTNSQVYFVLVAFILLLGMAAGSYPSFYLSAFKPAETLKGKLKTGFKAKGLRNGLVVVQFTISIALIICSAFVHKQLGYVASFDVGFERNNVLQIQNMEQLGEQWRTLQEEWSRHPAVAEIGRSFGTPPGIWEGERYKTKDPEHPVVEVSNFRVDGDYLNVLEVEFIAGRNFALDDFTDKHKIILNETAVKALGWGTPDTWGEDSPIGKQVVQAFDDEHEMEVIGVVKDFNYMGPHIRIAPLMILHYKNDYFWNHGRGPSQLSMRLNPEALRASGGIPALLDQFERDLKERNPSVLFEFSFLDDAFTETFHTEERMGKVLTVFTGMALVIAIMGLFGLASFSADQRTKELGIRKVLGAHVSQLVLTFVGEFTKLIAIAILLGIPLAAWAVSNWLQGFPFHTTMSWWVFAVVGIAALALALMTVGIHSLAAARKNPAITLHNE